MSGPPLGPHAKEEDVDRTTYVDRRRGRDCRRGGGAATASWREGTTATGADEGLSRRLEGGSHDCQHGGGAAAGGWREGAATASTEEGRGRQLEGGSRGSQHRGGIAAACWREGPTAASTEEGCGWWGKRV
jgi:hypothetical protein